MARHSFIQMSKLSNVKGRISYISDPKRQEYLYATFSTREDMTFWNDLAKECQEEFKRFGTEGKCIEARELIIALPEEYTKFDPNQVLREFTEQFKKRYDVECVSALHHNKTKKNYHIHLIFSERRLLPEPEVKIATRSVFYDELGKRVRTKKEITGEDGQIREGCIVIKKSSLPRRPGFSGAKSVRPYRKRFQVYNRKLTVGWTCCPVSSKRTVTPTYRRSRGRMTTPPPLWSSTTVTRPHGSGKSTEGSSPSRNRLKRRASERSSGIWRRRPNAGMTHGGSKHDPAATIMTEDAKTEKYTAGSPCGAYIGTPCKFEACRASI